MHARCLDTLPTCFASDPSHPPSTCNLEITWSFNSQLCRDAENGSYFIITFLLQNNSNVLSHRAPGVVDDSLSCNQNCDIDTLFSPANFTCQTVVLVLVLLLRNK